MKSNKVHRSSNYMTKKRRRRNAFKIAAAVLCTAAVAGIVVFALSITSNKPQTTSADASSNQVSSKSTEKNESDKQSLSNSKQNSEPYEYFNTYKYTEKLIDDDNLNDELHSKYVVLYDVNSDTVTFKKSAEDKCYPASTTKLLTAITASKILKEDTVVTVGDEITLIGEDSSVANLKQGQKLTVKQLMYAMILPSGNDAAYTLAVAAARTYKNNDKLSSKDAVKAFAELMNNTAKKLGAKSSNFTNPDGFHDKNQYSTAMDLLKIANCANSIPLIAKVCKTYQTTQKLKSGETITWINSNKLLDEGEYCYSKYAVGMKTGFTDEAGTCVIASFTKDKNTQIVVAMDSPELYDKYYDTLMLAKLGFGQNNIEFTYDELPPDY